MASVESNLGSVQASILKLAHAIDLTLPGADGSLGRDCLGTIAVGIADRTVAEQKQADGSALAELKPSTKKRKAAEGYPDIIGIETGNMLSLVELKGNQKIGADEATMEYGSTQDARDKARWFTEGRSGVQEPRPFYELDPQIEQAVDDLIEEHLTRFLEDL